jgi:hypothetical protein
VITITKSHRLTEGVVPTRGTTHMKLHMYFNSVKLSAFSRYILDITVVYL